jgi:hypothetical protein
MPCTAFLPKRNSTPHSASPVCCMGTARYIHHTVLVRYEQYVKYCISLHLVKTHAPWLASFSLRTVLYLPCSSPLGSVRHVQRSFLQERCTMYSVLYSENIAQCAVSLITVDNLPHTPLFFAEKSTPCKTFKWCSVFLSFGKNLHVSKQHCQNPFQPGIVFHLWYLYLSTRTYAL